MPLDNSLNVSELLRRLGVKGDSMGSASLLEALRLNLIVGDLSDLVPPTVVAMGGAAIAQNGGVGGFNKWSLLCRAPGGLVVTTLQTSTNNTYNLFISDTPIFGAIVQDMGFDYATGQNILSSFTTHTTGVRVLPNLTYQLRQLAPSFGTHFEHYVGPGASFNIEAANDNITQTISISWKEFPGAISPAE